MSDAETTAKPIKALGGLAVYGERRVGAMLLLGFAAGLPNLLIFDTLSAWLRDAGVTLDDQLTIACGDGAIRPVLIQRAGRPVMDRAALLRGRAIAAGTRLA